MDYIADIGLIYEKIIKDSYEFENILEKRMRPTTLMYHGTSSEFLRSILKHGLDPNPKQKSWDSGGELPSLGGVYMAPIMGRATKNAAKEAVTKYGGSPIIITIQVVSSSGTADEDDIFSSVAEQAFEAYRDPNSPYTQDYVSNILLRLNNKVIPNQQTPIKVKEFADAIIKILKDNNYPTNSGSYQAELWLSKRPELKEFILGVTNTVKPRMKETPSESSNVRITRPIGFSGKTKIVKIENMDNGEVYYPKNSR
jgi:hypothetical protein